ncbi:hypothetical protein E2C01_064055 [Portunus trituberculatus]|uniref:Uncharacterized protein n=1 Tax=Portunus trituberculatus TaxID=210409 RepID=A0A5B7HMQ5_PORTR|nr:hypothetical protein [Portunus trituberculatus]
MHSSVARRDDTCYWMRGRIEGQECGARAGRSEEQSLAVMKTSGGGLGCRLCSLFDHVIIHLLETVRQEYAARTLKMFCASPPLFQRALFKIPQFLKVFLRF